MRKQQRSSRFIAWMRSAEVVAGLCIAALVTSTASAENDQGFTQMLGDDLKAVFNETMMIGEYRAFRNLTETNDYTEFHFKDGSTDYKEGRQEERGIWTLVGSDKICYRYPDSNQYKQTYCFFVYESEGCYYKYSLQVMGLNGPRSFDFWSSRALRKGSGGSCAAPIS